MRPSLTIYLPAFTRPFSPSRHAQSRYLYHACAVRQSTYRLPHLRACSRLHLHRLPRLSPGLCACFPTFIIWSRNFLNNEPCSGLVKKSAIISPVGQYSTDISLALIRSVTKKYRMLMCRVRLLLDALPLFSNNIALWLSWYTTNSRTP